MNAEDQVTDAPLSALYAIEGLGYRKGALPVKAENSLSEAVEKVREALKGVNGYAPLSVKGPSLYYPDPVHWRRSGRLTHG